MQMVILPQLIWRFSVIPIKIPAGFFVEIKLILKLAWKFKANTAPKTTLKETDWECWPYLIESSNHKDRVALAEGRTQVSGQGPEVDVHTRPVLLTEVWRRVSGGRIAFSVAEGYPATTGAGTSSCKQLHLNTYLAH